MELTLDNMVKVSAEMIGQLIRPVFGSDNAVQHLATDISVRMLEGMACLMGFDEYRADEFVDNPLVGPAIQLSFASMILGMAVERLGIQSMDQFEALIERRREEMATDKNVGGFLFSEEGDLIRVIVFEDDDTEQEESSD